MPLTPGILFEPSGDTAQAAPPHNASAPSSTRAFARQGGLSFAVANDRSPKPNPNRSGAPFMTVPSS